MHRLALFLLTSLLVVGGLFLVSTGAQAGSSLNGTEKQIVKLHNKARAAHDVNRTLKPNPCLDMFAEKQARRQARKGRMYHQDLSPILTKCGVSAVGENVAYNYRTARQVHRAWMRSPGHRANILRKKFNRIGVGMALSKNGEPYYAVVFGTR